MSIPLISSSSASSSSNPSTNSSSSFTSSFTNSPFLPDSSSSQSSISKFRSSRPRYAPRRGIATFVSHSDDEEDVHPTQRTTQSQAPFRPKPNISYSQPLNAYTPRLIPNSNFIRHPSSFGHSKPKEENYKPPVHQSPDEYRITNTIKKAEYELIQASRSASRALVEDIEGPHSERISASQPSFGAKAFLLSKSTPLGRTTSLPYRKTYLGKVEEEAYQSLPSVLAGRKRSLGDIDPDNTEEEDEGEEGDDEESTNVKQNSRSNKVKAIS